MRSHVDGHVEGLDSTIVAVGFLRGTRHDSSTPANFLPSSVVRYELRKGPGSSPAEKLDDAPADLVGLLELQEVSGAFDDGDVAAGR